MSNGQTSNLWLISVSVDGQVLPGFFDKKSGGEVSGEEQKYRPGGSPTQVSLGSATNVSNVTVSRIYIRERDHALAKQLIARVGKGLAVITQQPLDEDFNPWGEPHIYRGRLNKVTVPEADSNSQSPSMFELEISTAGLPA